MQSIWSSTFGLGLCILLLLTGGSNGQCKLSPLSVIKTVNNIRGILQRTIEYCKETIEDISFQNMTKKEPDLSLLNARMSLVNKLLSEADEQLKFISQAKDKVVMIVNMHTSIEDGKKYISNIVGILARKKFLQERKRRSY